MRGSGIAQLVVRLLGTREVMPMSWSGSMTCGGTVAGIASSGLGGWIVQLWPYLGGVEWVVALGWVRA